MILLSLRSSLFLTSCSICCLNCISSWFSFSPAIASTTVTASITWLTFSFDMLARAFLPPTLFQQLFTLSRARSGRKEAIFIQLFPHFDWAAIKIAS